MATANSASHSFTDTLNEDLYNHLVLPQKLPHREDQSCDQLGVALLDRLVDSAKAIAAAAPSDDYGAA
jgi:hypothetical protein